MFYTLMKRSGHLRTLEKCRKHPRAARVFYIFHVLSKALRVLSQCNTRLRLFYLLTDPLPENHSKLAFNFFYSPWRRLNINLKERLIIVMLVLNCTFITIAKWNWIACYLILCSRLSTFHFFISFMFFTGF